jgi:hypothetical protein
MLGWDVAAALPELRAQAESLMVDTVAVERQDGTTLDPVTLEEVPAWTSVYSGKARVQRSGALSPRDDVAGGYEFPVGSLIVQAPLSAVGVVEGDRVTVTAVASVSDPDLVGVVATVKGNLAKTHATKRTLVCEEVG